MKGKPILSVIVLALVAFLINKAILWLFVDPAAETQWVYSLLLLYAFFGLFAAIIVWVLFRISQKSINNVGYTFLLLTSVKMAIAYVFLRPILAAAAYNPPLEKTNFFIIFLYFLAVETAVTIRILNTKQ